MSYQETIAGMLERVLTGPMGIAVGEIQGLSDWIEVPKKKDNGDFAFPCFRLARVLRRKPQQIAEDLAPHLEAEIVSEETIAELRVIGPYLNFVVNKADLAGSLIPAILSGDYLGRRADKNEKVMIEYSQPNTHKAFHVGHTRNVALGDALWRIFDWSGYQVIPANYIGDEGTHIAKCLWYYRTQFQGQTPNENRGEFLGELYSRATLMLDFSLLTQCPMPQVHTARVDSIDQLADSEKLKIVIVDTGDEKVQVVCGGIAYAVGDVVAYARPGARVGGRLIDTLTKQGIESTGMILSEKELGMSEDNQTIFRFPAETSLGVAVAEYFRREDAPIPANKPVLEVMEERSTGVATTLKALEAREPEVDALWQETKEWSMDAFYDIYRWLDVRFDHYYFESDVGDTGKKICHDFYEKGVLVKSEGAIGADLQSYKLPFLILIKSDGAGIYATKDIALAKDKFERFGIDRSIYVVDASQSLHFQQVFKTLELMGYEKARNCYHLAYGLVVLPDGKMSSRDGNIILLSELRRRLDEKIRSEFLEKYRGNWPDEEIEEAARRIAIATIKYGMNNQDNLKIIVFDLDEWTERSGNTGPYMMYAYARTRSILREAGDYDAALADWSLLQHESEQRLLTTMSKFHEIVGKACAEYRPQNICIYLFQIAKDFSRFYDNCPVLKAESEALRISRLQVVDAAGQIIGKALSLLGIKTLERM